MSQLVGKKLYKTGFTEIFETSINVDGLLDYKFRENYSDKDVENLTPLKVVETKFLFSIMAVVLKVELPNKQEKLLFGNLKDYYTKYGFKRTELQRMGISAEEKIPSIFSKEEINAIRNRLIFRGMSQRALSWSWGYPSKSNDWGRGGTQDIYNGVDYVYIKNDKVIDWQSIR
ncbi:MAG: hypothetical protein KA413_03650 [Candidatus Methylopumilus sp.]|nr:hypothetical protein [Candidatus Methylopumilus sp.]